MRRLFLAAALSVTLFVGFTPVAQATPVGHVTTARSGVDEIPWLCKVLRWCCD